MATLDVLVSHEQGRLGPVRCALTGAAVLAIQFVVCWAAAAGGLLDTNSHLFVSLFTLAPVASFAALAAGLCWSLVFGALTGALIAWVWNGLAFVGRR